MAYIEYPLENGYINRFMVTDVDARPQRFEKAVLRGKVNEWLKKGFAIHENPCRKEFIEKRRGVLPDPAGSYKWRMYFPFGNIGMEASGFYFVPTYLRSYSKVEVFSSARQNMKFQLETCGAATLWLDGRLVINFAPFTRNAAKTVEFEIPFNKGGNDITICLEDLAERDTDYFFRLRCMDDDSGLVMRLPLGGLGDPSELAQIEAMLSDINFDKEVYVDEPGRLRITNPFDKNIAIDLEALSSNWIGTLTKREVQDIRRNSLAPGRQCLSIPSIHSGYYCFHVSCDYCGIIVGRIIGAQFASGNLQNINEPVAEKRKSHMIDLVADSEIHNVFKACAILHKNGDMSLAQAIVTGELAGIAAKMDCSDFHFAIVLHLYIAHADRLSPTLKAAIRRTMLGYRYWIDEPGDDVMWFFSENHALMFHVCQYLAGGLLPDEIFEASGRKGANMRKKAEKLLGEWFEHFFDEFITEWHSSAYIPVDFLGLAILFIHGDEDLRKKSKKAMDMLCRCLATCAYDGALMTTAGRIYEKELKGAFVSGTTGILHMLYNTGTACRADFALPLAISSYEPPAQYARCINPASDSLIFQSAQGFEKHVSTYIYKDAYGILSTSVNFKPFENGYQEHIAHCALGKTAQVFVNHPGECHPYGTGRPNFWAGNGVLPLASQEGDTAILRYNLGNHRIGYTHAYVPLSEFDEHIISDNIVALRKGQGFVGVMAKNGMELVKKGPCAKREFISEGAKNVWAIKLGNADMHGSLSKFLDTVGKINIE